MRTGRTTEARDRLETIVIIPGNPDERGFTCITDDARPDLSHAWSRAASHIFRFKDMDYFLQMEAATTCRHMVEAILKQPRPPARVPVKWGWGKGWPGQ